VPATSLLPIKSQADHEAWLKTADGQKHLQAQNARRTVYAVLVGPDGAFRADDIPPGEYQLLILVHAANLRPSGGAVKLQARATLEFAMGADPDGRSGQPLDLGALTLTPADSPVHRPAVASSPATGATTQPASSPAPQPAADE
jgi:hypothetical protein